VSFFVIDLGRWARPGGPHPLKKEGGDAERVSRHGVLRRAICRAMTRDDLVMKLIATGHLNVHERRLLGGDVLRAEVVSTVLRGLREHGHFPPNARPWAPGQACFEGWQLVALGHGARLVAQRHPPLEPFTLAEAKSEDFSAEVEAVEHYVKYAVGSNIDGVPVR
jgi:hypothetical protein